MTYLKISTLHIRLYISFDIDLIDYLVTTYDPLHIVLAFYTAYKFKNVSIYQFYFQSIWISKGWKALLLMTQHRGTTAGLELERTLVRVSLL